MIRSMTGFGRAQRVLRGREIAVEVKSVNSRYFEYSSRLPRGMAFLDDMLKKAAASAVGRGKTELHLSVQSEQGAEICVSANLAAARGYRDAIAAIAAELGMENDVRLSHLAAMPDVFTQRREQADERELAEDVAAVAAEALCLHAQMRESEGEELRRDVQNRLRALRGMLGEVEKGSEGRAARYTEKLYERLKELLNGACADEGRVLAEAAIFADRTAVDEETVRLRSHIEQFETILGGGGQVGRKLDFLTQEMNRETNTIGSKCMETELTRVVVDMKAEIEKIREQIQNIE